MGGLLRSASERSRAAARPALWPPEEVARPSRYLPVLSAYLHGANVPVAGGEVMIREIADDDLDAVRELLVEGLKPLSRLLVEGSANLGSLPCIEVFRDTGTSWDA